MRARHQASLKRGAPFALLLPFLLATTGESTSVKRMSHADLVRNAGAIFHGDVVSVRAEWNETRTRIYTRVTFRVREVLKGEKKDRITMKVPGGVLDGRVYVIHGMPRFSEGMEVVVYATKPHQRSGVAVPVGLGQGLYEVDRNGEGGPVARRDTRRLFLVDPGRVGGGAAGRLESKLLEQHLADIRREVLRQKEERERKR